MNNLFSIFDPSTPSMGLPMNWLSSLVCVSVVPQLFWLTKTQYYFIWSGMLKFVYQEFLALLGQFSAPGSLFVPLSLFTYILCVNSLGLIPYAFAASSHLTFSFSLALPLWLGHMVFSWTNQPNAMFAHLVPLGTPNGLLPFMVIIELISSVIRPLTLSVRLAANIVAGHLLLTLLGSQGNNISGVGLITLLTGLIGLSILESAVALIQAYVFSVLSTLYLSEVDSGELNLPH